MEPTDPRQDAWRLAEDLEAFRAGDLAEADFRARWKAPGASRVVHVVWQNIEHYLADADIRARDPGYRAMQDSELAKLLKSLREGASEPELARIHFLGPSR
jgi:hypothetical protein